MDVILDSIRGLGGTILKTNVDLERARLIQSALTAEPDEAIRTDPQEFAFAVAAGTTTPRRTPDDRRDFHE